jgi:hypothetical protein
MTYQRFVQQSLLLVFASFLLVWTGCKTEDPLDDVDTQAELAKLADTWVRVLSNNPSQDGMKVRANDGIGTVTDKAASSYNVGDVKWSAIEPVASNEYNYEELGSDGNYYPASMVRDQDTIRINVANSGAGNEQKWVREGNYTAPGPSAETITLDCSGISTATTWRNGPAAIDYIVPNGCVVDIKADLEIEAGTVIAMSENSGLGVYDNGSIKAVGTAASPIIIKGLDPVSGYWRGIHIETNTLNNQFDHVQISGAGSNYVYCCNAVASLFLKSSGKVSLKNTTISNGDGFGISASGETSLREYENITITSHVDYPLSLHIERVSELDGDASDYTGNTRDFALVYGSDVDEPTTFSALNVPYRMENGQVFDLKESTTIGAGVEMVFGEGSGLGVYGDGTLTVSGTAAAPVIMRGAEAIRGYWRGIHIETSSINNKIDHAQISDAGSNYVYCCNPIATVFLKDGKTSITNSEISNGGSYGITSGNGFEFGDFANNVITTHAKAPVYLTMNQMGQLDGTASDFSGNDEDYLLLGNAELSREATLLRTNIPYRVGSGTVINVTNPLTISAGVEMEFGENAGLGVYDDGTLNAVGTSGSEIIFRGANAVNGFWRGIHSETSSNNNRFDYVTVANAGSNYVYCCNGVAGLFLRSGTFSVTNSTFAQSGGCGILVNAAATLTQSGNSFDGNTDGDLCP